MNKAAKMTFHMFFAGKVVSSIIVGVISKPMNLIVNTPEARKRP